MQSLMLAGVYGYHISPGKDYGPYHEPGKDYVVKTCTLIMRLIQPYNGIRVGFSF